MRRRREAPAMPAGYMDALGRLYGKQPIAGPETAPERTQSTGALPVPHLPKRKPEMAENPYSMRNMAELSSVNDDKQHDDISVISAR